MATLGKPKIRIPVKDLKQAVLKKNKSLESKNKTLESAIKVKEKELKSLEKEYSSETKKLTSLSKDVQFEEERVQKIKSGVFSNERLLAEKLKKIDKAEQEFCEYESAIEKLGDKESSLKKAIETLEFYKSECKDSKVDLIMTLINKNGKIYYNPQVDYDD